MFRFTRSGVAPLPMFLAALVSACHKRFSSNHSGRSFAQKRGSGRQFKGRFASPIIDPAMKIHILKHLFRDMAKFVLTSYRIGAHRMSMQLTSSSGSQSR